MIIDELYISEEDTRKIKDGERSEFAELLEYLRGKCDKTVIVLSSSSVSDFDFFSSGKDMTNDQLTGVIQSSGYKFVTLDKVMRNTSSITNSVTADSFNSYYILLNISPSIPSGRSSTVTGHKPTAVIYSDVGNYSVLGQCVRRYLDGNPHILNTRLAILCEENISVRELQPEISSLFPDMKCYDAGIEKFDYNRPVYRDNADNSDENAVIRWLEEGGTLLTHAPMFRGCEAESVIVVRSTDIFGDTPRSPLTRGVANLCLIISDWDLNQANMKKHFNIINL